MTNYTSNIHISEILRESEKWLVTRNWFGKIEYRELEKFGNRHTIFEKDSEWGTVHHDQYNATSFPEGTINHLAKWGNEKMGLDEALLRLTGWVGLIYVGKKVYDNI